MKHKDKILELYNSGMSYSQIQKELGCSKGTISYHVGLGQKEKTAERSRKIVSKIRKYVQEYKQELGCTDCKEKYPYWILDLDHLEDKKFSINKFKDYTRSLDVVIEEMKKCEVVCANCHRNRTFLRSLASGSSILDIEGYYQ